MSVVKLTEIRGGKSDWEHACDLAEDLAAAINKYAAQVSVVTMVGLLEALKLDILQEAMHSDD